MVSNEAESLAEVVFGPKTDLPTKIRCAAAVKKPAHLSYFLAQIDSNLAEIHEKAKMSRIRPEFYTRCAGFYIFSYVSITRLK